MNLIFNLLVVLQQYSASAEPRDGWSSYSSNFPLNNDPFETDSLFKNSGPLHGSLFDPFKSNPPKYDPFKDNPFFNPSASPPASVPLTSISSTSGSSSDEHEHSEYHVCPICKAYHKKRPKDLLSKPKVGDLFSSAVASTSPTLATFTPSTYSPPPSYSSLGAPPSSDSHSNYWLPGAALATGALAGGLLSSHSPPPPPPPSYNYYDTSSSSKPTIAHTSSGGLSKPIKHSSSSSSSSSSENDKKKKGSGWKTGAALAGGALAGGILASNPAISKPPYNSYGSQSYSPPAYQAPNPHGCSYCIRQNCDPASCREAPNFNAKRDAERLQHAMKGLGTDEKTIIEILTQRSDEQIEMIRQEYVRSGRTMSSDLEGDTSFKTKELLDALATPRSLFYAEQLEHAFKKGDTDTLIEIFTSLSDCAIREVSSEFTKRFRKALPESIEKKTCLDFENFLLELAKGNRDPNGPVDVAAAKKDASALISAGVDMWFGTDEETFIKIFATRSWVQLKEVLKQYELKRKSGIENDIKSETSGKLQKGLLTLVKNIKDQPAYFADQLENSLDTLIKPGPNDNHKLVRIMRGRCGVDLGDIRDAYPRTHKGKKLASRLAGKTYMDYQAALLAMIKQ